MAFEKKWRDRKIVHRTPGGKMTRVKISSLTAEEQQKYNPNRYKRGADTKMGPDDYAALQKNDVDAGHIFDFYIQAKEISDLDDIKDGAMTLATTDSKLVRDLFDDDKQVVKIKNLPMEAVKKVMTEPEDGERIDIENADDIPFDDLGDMEGVERYEKIKFNDGQLYQIDIAPYLEYVDVVLDEPDSEDDDGIVSESFYNYYFIGD